MKVPIEAKDFGFPGARVTGSFEPIEVGCWEPNFISLQEQHAHLTSESSLQFSDPNFLFFQSFVRSERLTS